MYVYGNDCLLLIPFRLPQIICFTLSLKCFFSNSDNCPDVGIGPPGSVPPPAEGRSSPTNAPVFLPSSFALLSFMWFYIFFSTGQVLLPALSWCSACTSVSEGVFLMYPWREMCSMSTYSSAILFSVTNFLTILLALWRKQTQDSMCVLWKIHKHFLLDQPKKKYYFLGMQGKPIDAKAFGFLIGGRGEENERTGDCGSLSFWAQTDKLNNGLELPLVFLLPLPLLPLES